ncbi:dipeptidyl peptidase 2-like [Paramacrobiotus metropolitanus]|uniref:dipeptidyl peptidase 2-like n=1 Tax=Paramacrobiotus metropolitanus TaxID=2943436 RepID=UPI002446150D|nr:dipeptidyl peptidase 2-like [Paramacrobiotus metropolitanus]
MAFQRLLVCAFLACLLAITAYSRDRLAASRRTDPPPYKELYFDQVLDHFNYNAFDVQTFKQRYLICSKFWNPNTGPIFFYTGNEGPITSFYANTGFMFDIAPQFEALIVFAEHRFYGKSLPAGPSKSFQNPYIGLLTVEQALADYAVLMDAVTAQLNATNTPIIAFGGSYGGILSSYMRQKYPNIIDGALAASAPVFGIADIGDNRTFFEDVTKYFSAVPGCGDRVREAFTAMDTLSGQGPDGYRNLSITFNLCDPLNPNGGYKQLVGWVRNAFASMAMVNYPYPAQFLAPLPAWPVNASCQYITGNPKGALAGLAQAANLFYSTSEKCHDIWAEFDDCADPTGCGTGTDATAWDYQACTQMTLSGGTYGGQEDFFPYLPWTKDLRAAYCQKHYAVVPRDSALRIEYGAQRLSAASNIIFSNGLLDPWHRGGVLQNVSETVVAVLVAEGAHHLDLRAADSRDPPSVIAARQQEVELIKRFVKDGGSGAMRCRIVIFYCDQTGVSLVQTTLLFFYQMKFCISCFFVYF